MMRKRWGRLLLSYVAVVGVASWLSYQDMVIAYVVGLLGTSALARYLLRLFAEWQDADRSARWRSVKRPDGGWGG